MITNKRQERNDATESKVKLGKLTLNRETIKELTGREAKLIRGGAMPTRWRTCNCGLSFRCQP